jgi:hypothetical protein
VNINYSTAQQVELGGVPRPKVSLADVYSVYRSLFRRLLWIALPPSLLAAVVFARAEVHVQAIFASIPRGEIPHAWDKLAEAGLARYGSFFVSWLLGCMVLAAIATVVNDLDDSNEVWIKDSYQRARERPGALLVVALFTFCLLLAGLAGVGLIGIAVVRVVGWAHFARFNFFTALVGYAVVASIVSWFGMAIPLILDGERKVWRALKKSVTLSNGYEGFLFLLVLESMAGPYVTWYAVHYGFSLLLPFQPQYAEWYGWLVYFALIVASAALEPPMFIGFALLAATGRTDSSLSLPGAQQPADVD